MSGHAMGTLPGGLPTGHGLARDYAFRPADGRLELAIGEIAHNGDEAATSTPRAVSLVLAAALQHLGDEIPSLQAINALCVADRQYLMRALAQHLGDDGGWFAAQCSQCKARFDFQLSYAELPVKPAGTGFPQATVEVHGQALRVRVPTGADQLALLARPDEQQPHYLLAALLDHANAAHLASELSTAERERIEAALEDIAPAVVCEVGASCPECGAANQVGIDPYIVLARDATPLLAEVHRLALHYHWSEADILALPKARRQRYLMLIDQSRGMSQ
ncbi:hypothetical protein [Chitinimonas naiadis]